MQVYNSKNNEKTVYINNVKTIITDSAAIAIESFGSNLRDIAAQIGIEVKPLFQMSDAETLQAANAVNAYEKDGAKGLFLNGKMISFTFNGEECEADENEAKTHFGIN